MKVYKVTIGDHMDVIVQAQDIAGALRWGVAEYLELAPERGDPRRVVAYELGEKLIGRVNPEDIRKERAS